VRPDFPCEHVAAAFFSAAEAAAVRAFRPHERSGAFFRCWTRKEAYLKARGDGLTVDLASFDVSLDECPVLLRESAEPGRFVLYDLDAPLSHAVALAADGSRARVSQWVWT
jgi:4'-phosphopantetheinyl transferase